MLQGASHIPPTVTATAAGIPQKLWNGIYMEDRKEGEKFDD